jgi:hypothetical protein
MKFRPLVRPLLASALLFGLALGGCVLRPAPASTGVQISEVDGKIRVMIGGRLFTEYVYQNVDRPYFYPLLGPGGLPMTRHWPIEDGEGEEQDHPHHRSLWYAHSSVNGFDFWTEGKKCKIVHQKFLKVESGQDSGVIQSENDWIDSNGVVQCRDTRTIRFYNRPDHERLFDFDITLEALPDKAVTFGDDKDGAMAVRVAESMRVNHKEKAGEGHIVLSTGVRDKKAWGHRADWCEYDGPVEGKTVGIAIFDHPQNPRHPTWWHVRDYGLFAANPFGVHDFEKKPKGTGDFVIPPGKSVTFRYRFYLHDGDEREARVAEHYQEYADEK